MTKLNALELIPTVAAIRGTVLERRNTCKTDFARSLHETLVEKLDAVTGDLHEEVAIERWLAAAAGTPDGGFLAEIYHACSIFESRWIEGGPVSLLDPIHVDVTAIGEGEICRVGLDFTEIPASELEGLGEIMDVIARDIGVRFIAART